MAALRIPVQRAWTLPRSQPLALRSFFSSRPAIQHANPDPVAGKASSSDSLNRNASSPSANGQPDLGTFSFKDLGMSRPVKIVVYSFLTVIGALETYTYGRWLYGKFLPEDPGDDTVEESTR